MPTDSVGTYGMLLCGLAIIVFLAVFLRIVGKEKAHLERLILIKKLRAERAARARELRRQLEAQSRER